MARSCAPGEPANETPVATDVSGSVPATLSLTIAGTGDLGVLRPGVARDYETTLGATVTSTAGSATLSVHDPGAMPGRLVNGSFVLPRPLELKAGGGAFAAPSGAPLPLLTFPGPVSNDAVQVALRQPIGASDGLRTGRYGKTITFTLSTDAP